MQVQVQLQVQVKVLLLLLRVACCCSSAQRKELAPPLLDKFPRPSPTARGSYAQQHQQQQQHQTGGSGPGGEGDASSGRIDHNTRPHLLFLIAPVTLFFLLFPFSACQQTENERALVDQTTNRLALLLSSPSPPPTTRHCSILSHV